MRLMLTTFAIGLVLELGHLFMPPDPPRADHIDPVPPPYRMSPTISLSSGTIVWSGMPSITCDAQLRSGESVVVHQWRLPVMGYVPRPAPGHKDPMRHVIRDLCIDFVLMAIVMVAFEHFITPL